MTDKFIKRLIDTKAINIKEYIINNYVNLGLDEKSAMLLIHIYNFKENGIDFLSINNLTSKMSIEFVECSNLVLSLVQRQFISFDLEVDDFGKTKEKYTLTPLYEKIFMLINQDSQEIVKENEGNQVVELIHIIETEFGRTLSSFEIQIITSWINEYRFSFDLIKLAIKEALLSNAYNLKYVDRILINWNKKNIVSVEDAKAYTKTFKRFEYKKENPIPIEEQEVYVSWMK